MNSLSVPPLHVLLVGNFRADQQLSMLRFEAMLAQGLTQRGHTVTRTAPCLFASRLARPYRYAGWPKIAGYFDKFILFPWRLRRQIRRFRPDIVHVIDHANAVYLRCAGSTTALITCHDLLQAQLSLGRLSGPRPTASGRCFQRWILRQLRRAPFTVCVSHKTQADFLALTGRTGKLTEVIPNGLNFPFRRQDPAKARALLIALCERQGIPHAVIDGFVINVAGTQWYKNRPGLLAIHGHLRARLPHAPALLLVGKEQLLPLESGPVDGVYQTGPVSDAELEALYSLADALIYPSLAEGFGWPIAEAQACGCPVFTSDRAPMTEVGGDAAVYFDPADAERAAAIIAAAWGQRDVMRAQGLQRADLWSADQMLSAYEHVYRKLATAPLRS